MHRLALGSWWEVGLRWVMGANHSGSHRESPRVGGKAPLLRGTRDRVSCTSRWVWAFPPCGNDAIHAGQSPIPFLSVWSEVLQWLGAWLTCGLGVESSVMTHESYCCLGALEHRRALWKHLYLIVFLTGEVGSSCLNLAVACSWEHREEDTAYAFMLQKLSLCQRKSAFIECNSGKLISSRSGPLKTWPLYPRSGLEQKMLRCSVWLALINHTECGEEGWCGAQGLQAS